MGVIRKTRSVERILDSFKSKADAMSVVELVELHAPVMNKTTVYRVLERLEDSGTLHSFTGKDGLRYYAKCHECTPNQHLDTHPHFQCKTCGKTECLSESVIIPEISNLKIEKAELLLLGQCEHCAK